MITHIIENKLDKVLLIYIEPEAIEFALLPGRQLHIKCEDLNGLLKSEFFFNDEGQNCLTIIPEGDNTSFYCDGVDIFDLI